MLWSRVFTALVQVYCPNQCPVSGNTDEHLQPSFPCITLLESEVSSSSYPPKAFVVRHTGENEERSNHHWVSKICLCGCPSNSFHSTLSLWLPFPALCIPLFMLMLQPEPDHTIWAPVSTTDLVCWCAPRSTPDPRVLWSGSTVLSPSQGGLEHFHALKPVHDHLVSKWIKF